MDEAATTAQSPIRLSHFTRALVENFKAIRPKVIPDETSRISVSQTVSFFAIAYEKLRNAVEYRESHLIRRAVIERILKRRLTLNPEAAGEGEDLLRELLWARYFPNESLGEHDIAAVQKLLDRYITIRRQLNSPRDGQFLFDLLTCTIEEILSPEEAKRNTTFTFFIYQVLKDKVKIENVPEDEKNAYFYVTLEKWFAKSDNPYLRYRLFTLYHESIFEVSSEKLPTVLKELPQIFTKVDELIANPYSNRLRAFVNNQTPPFNILFEIFKKDGSQAETILIDRHKLGTEVEQIARIKYAQTRSRLNSLAIKAIIYIFITKMLFALILEYPLSLYFYREVSYFSLAINSLFPPVLMFVIIWMTKIPGEENTRKLFDRLVNIIDADKSFETTISFITKKTKPRRRLLIFAFTIVYALTFLITFDILNYFLMLLHFNLVSEIIFLFFISIVSFFAYRIRQIAKEYQLREGESFIRPFIDFFFLPILSAGKWLSSGIAKLNFFTFIFDFVIEAPFKLVFEVIEEWIRFIRTKKEEIV